MYNIYKNIKILKKTVQSHHIMYIIFRSPEHDVYLKCKDEVKDIKIIRVKQMEYINLKNCTTIISREKINPLSKIHGWLASGEVGGRINEVLVQWDPNQRGPMFMIASEIITRLLSGPYHNMRP